MAKAVAKSRYKMSARFGIATCTDCGAIVGDTTVHDTWHTIWDRLLKVAGVLEDVHVSAAVHGTYDTAARLSKPRRKKTI